MGKITRPEAKTPQYKAWVKAVYKRDNYMCKMCGYQPRRSRHIQAHHIKKWSDYPLLRYVVANGITLCYKCHKSIWGKEEQYESLFYTKLGQSTSCIDLSVELYRMRKAEENAKIQNHS